MKALKYLLPVLTFLSISILSANDDAIRKISELFTQRSDKIMTVVTNKALDKKTRNDKIIEIVEPMFDFMLMGKLSLGKDVWRSLDEKKQIEFTDLYVERMKNSYSKKVDIYTDEKIIITSASQENPSRITLITNLVGTNENTEVIYKYYKPKNPLPGKDEWLVYDAIIIGVSIIKTDRSQFQEVLQSGSLDLLMDKMRESID